MSLHFPSGFYVLLHGPPKAAFLSEKMPPSHGTSSFSDRHMHGEGSKTWQVMLKTMLEKRCFQDLLGAAGFLKMSQKLCGPITKNIIIVT